MERNHNGGWVVGWSTFENEICSNSSKHFPKFDRQTMSTEYNTLGDIATPISGDTLPMINLDIKLYVKTICFCNT